MACANSVDPALRSAVRSAQQEHYRCFKISVEDPPKGQDEDDDSVAEGLEDMEDIQRKRKPRMLKLEEAMKEEPNQPLDKEFMRCVKPEPKTPLLFLFRTDENENLAGSRWLLISWLPLDAPEVKRAIYVRSRGLVARLVQQPYFLSELLAKDARQLTWSVAREQGLMFGGGVGSSAHNLTTELSSHTVATELVPGAKAIAPRPTPVSISEKASQTMINFGTKMETCIRLFSSKEDLVARGRGATVIEVKSEHCQTPVALAQMGSAHALPNSNCYFAMHVKDAIYFVFWCPDNSTKDIHRVTEDIRHAALKASITTLVMQALPKPWPRLVTIDAREPQDIVDGAAGQPVGAGDRKRGERSSIKPAEPDISNALGGYAFGVYGADRGPSQPPKMMNCSLALPERPFPPWLGGSKAHTIVSSSSGSHKSHGHSGHSGHRERVEQASHRKSQHGGRH